jgi:hypothetical protein
MVATDEIRTNNKAAANMVILSLVTKESIRWDEKT